jgi:GNAT superfamily N-acetyltransferase
MILGRHEILANLVGKIREMSEISASIVPSWPCCNSMSVVALGISAYKPLSNLSVRSPVMSLSTALYSPFIPVAAPRCAWTELCTSAAPASTHAVTSRRDIAEFVDLPKRIYQHDANWVAPLDMQVREFLDARKHPFYRHGDAQAFIAKRDGQTIGRILVSDDPTYNQTHGVNLGCFGMFEAIDDVRTARALFDRASAWLRTRGRTQMMGPIDYSTNYPCGLLVDGFDTPPAVMMNHHPKYYQRLFQRNGMEKAKDLYAWWINRDNNMDASWSERVTKLASRYGVKVRPMDFNNFDAEIARCKSIYHQSLGQNWGFVKMSGVEFDHLAHNLKRLAVPELVQLAELDGKPVGVSITLPNVNEAIQPLSGRLMTGGLPIGLIRLACRMRKIRTCRLAVLGVVPGYRKRGVAESLILETMKAGTQKFDYQGAELSWTLEDNTLVNRMIERVGGKQYKTYRIFTKNLVR